MNLTAITGGAGLIACLVLAFLWKSEQVSHGNTKQLLIAETLRANVATEKANNNALKVKELEKDIAVQAERAKFRAIESANILAIKNDDLAKMRQRMGAWSDAIEKRPKVAERAMRAELNRRLRELTKITCRTNCRDTDSSESAGPSSPP